MVVSARRLGFGGHPTTEGESIAPIDNQRGYWGKWVINKEFDDSCELEFGSRSHKTKKFGRIGDAKHHEKSRISMKSSLSKEVKHVNDRAGHNTSDQLEAGQKTKIVGDDLDSSIEILNSKLDRSDAMEVDPGEGSSEVTESGSSDPVFGPEVLFDQSHGWEKHLRLSGQDFLDLDRSDAMEVDPGGGSSEVTESGSSDPDFGPEVLDQSQDWEKHLSGQDFWTGFLDHSDARE